MTKRDDVHAILDVYEEWEADNDVALELVLVFDLAERLQILVEQARNEGSYPIWQSQVGAREPIEAYVIPVELYRRDMRRARKEGEQNAVIEVYDDEGYYGGPQEHEPITSIELTFNEYNEKLANAKDKGAAEERKQCVLVARQTIPMEPETIDYHRGYNEAKQNIVDAIRNAEGTDDKKR